MANFKKPENEKSKMRAICLTQNEIDEAKRLTGESSLTKIFRLGVKSLKSDK